jgi:hypothetical protein
MPDVRICPKCQHQNRTEARFCSQCGNSLAGVPLSSPAPLQPPPRPQVEGMRWRPRPGELAARVEPRDLPAANRDTLIVEENTLAVVLRDGVVVGQQGPGLYKVQDVASGFLGLGRRPEMTAILLDSGEIPVEFNLNDLWTVDPLRLNATCRLVVQISDAQRFIGNVLKDRPTFAVTDLRQLLFPDVFDAAQAYVGDHSMEQLEAERNQRREDFAVDVQERLRDFFSQTGLAFKRVQMFDLRHPRIDAMRGEEEELFLGPADFDLDQRRFEQKYARKQAEQRGVDRNRELDLNAQRQDFAHRKRLFDLTTEEELHKLAQEETGAAQFEQRAQVWDRMRRAVQQDKLNAATTEEAWAKFVAEADTRKLLREDELKQFRDSLRWGDEDRQKARAHTIVLAELFSQYERKAAELSEQHKYDQAKLQNELASQRTAILGKLELRQAEVEASMRLDAAERARQQATTAAERQAATEAADHARAELAKAEAARREQERAEYEHKATIDSAALARQRAERTADVKTDIDIQTQKADANSTVVLQQAKTADAIARLQRQREQEEDEADLALAARSLAMLKENQAAKQRMAREDEEEKRRIAREDELRRQDAALAAEKARLDAAVTAEQARHTMDMARTAQQQQHEISRMKTMNELSVEALIAMSDVQQGQILAELKRTEQFKGMSEDQLLILVAERNPAVAQALQVKLQAAADGKLQTAEAAKWQALADERTKYEAELRKQMEAQQAAQLKGAQESAAREAQAMREAADRAERMAKEAAERQERSNSEALRVVGDVARTYAQHQPAPAAGPTVIMTPGGAPGGGTTVLGGAAGAATGGSGAASGEVQVCPNCRVKMPVGEKFCANCGHQFFG